MDVCHLVVLFVPLKIAKKEIALLNKN